MIRATVLTIGIGAALAATAGTASAQFFAPPFYNPYPYSTVVSSSYYYTPTTVVTPLGGYVTTPVYTSYYTPTVVYPYRVYRPGFVGFGYRAPVFRPGSTRPRSRRAGTSSPGRRSMSTPSRATMSP